MKKHKSILKKSAPPAASPAPPRPAPVGPGADRPRVPDEAIRTRAYQKWEEAGRPDGDGVAFWLEAERELARPR